MACRARAGSGRWRADLALAVGEFAQLGPATPTCMLERASPSDGTRLMAPTGSAVDEDDALVALRTSGRRCTMKGSRKACSNNSSSETRFWLPSSMKNTPAPPLP